MSEKTQPYVEILKAVLITGVDSEYTWMDFFKMLCIKKDI
jgi:hypothetical protein